MNQKVHVHFRAVDTDNPTPSFLKTPGFYHKQKNHRMLDLCNVDFTICIHWIGLKEHNQNQIIMSDTRCQTKRYTTSNMERNVETCKYLPVCGEEIGIARPSLNQNIYNTMYKEL